VTTDLHEPLEAPAVRETVEELYGRIEARFPQRGLLGVCGDLILLVEEVQSSAGQGQRQIRWVRVASRVVMAFVIVVTILALLLALHDAFFDDGVKSSIDMLGLAETAISDLVYAAIAIFFLWSFPERLQRSRLLNLLHQLRSTAHVIDMHQLTKDPEQLKPSWVPTAKSTKLNMTRDQVERYLDYCSEMLSLVGKTAALCAEESRDSVILETVSTIETLTVGLSRKIWQKISNLPPGEPAKRPGVVAEEPTSPGV
jgi:predicted membrane channel-forming protein YqfA (hemolysin III family)